MAATRSQGNPLMSAQPRPGFGDSPIAEVEALFDLPFNDLLYRAHTVHRAHHAPNCVQLSTLLSVKTGACPEDCAYCPQSARHKTGLKAERLMTVAAVAEAARAAKANGATRFCIGAAWRSPRDKDLDSVCDMVRAIKAEGLESCATLGMLDAPQSQRLKDAGLDYYNHNLDTSREFYPNIIGTRVYDERLATLAAVRTAGMKVCCGGIIGMGESRRDRAALLATLAALPEPPDSVPINQLVPIPGTPLADQPPTDPFEFVRTIAAARIVLPRAQVRLSAGREEMSDELQALCFFAGANSIFYGEKLLTAPNAGADRDRALFARLGLMPAQ
jgi:biotin synthase